MREELAGPPTYQECLAAIERLHSGTSPGANRLKPEFFKFAKEEVAVELVKDFKLIWPRRDDAGDSEKAKVDSAWQDAEVVPIYKGKGSKKDPSNFRGIFHLDVCGKVLSSVLNRRIQKATELNIGDEPTLSMCCGEHRKRSGQPTTLLLLCLWTLRKRLIPRPEELSMSV